MSRRLPLRITDWVAAAFWAGAIGLAFVAAAVGPAESCGYDNHDMFVVEARRSGLVLFGSALALVAAAALLLGGGVASRRRGRVVRLIAGLISLAAAGYVAFIALLEYLHFGCLE